MAPSRTARTFEEDPNFMILYYAFTSLTEKPDYEAVATKTGLPTAAAAKKRLERLTRLQADAENDVDGDTACLPAATTTVTKAENSGGTKAKAGKSGGAGRAEEKVKFTAKKRKVKHAEDGGEVSDDGKKA